MYNIYIYIYIYVYILYTITSSCHEQDCLMRLFQEILLPSLGLIKHIHDVSMNKHWADKRKYIPYISVAHKALKSRRSKMAIWAHDVCDVHGASSLYIKICCQSSFIYYVFYI